MRMNGTTISDNDSLIACLATRQILQGGMTSSPTCQKRESTGTRLVRHAT